MESRRARRGGWGRKGVAVAAVWLLGWAGAVSSIGQGAVNFNNKVAGVVDAPFLLCSGRPEGFGYIPGMKVTLCLVAPNGVVTQVGKAASFRTNPPVATGYFDGGTIIIPGNYGTPVKVRLRYFAGEVFYENSTHWGETPDFEITPTLLPDVPADLTGLGKEPIYMGGAWDVCPGLFIHPIGNEAVVLRGGTGVFREFIEIPELYESRPVVGIADNAFTGDRITSVGIPKTVEYIGSGAFSFSGLTNVFIPSTVINIMPRAFVKCLQLRAIEVDPTHAHYASRDGVLFDKAMTNLFQYPAGRSGDYAVPDGVKTIVPWAFWGAGQMTTVSLPDSLVKVDAFSFLECTGLKWIAIPESVDSLGEYSFGGCTNLQAVLFKGDAAPDLGNQFFGTPATVYYLPGAKGWGATFGGAPTAVWDPQAEELSVGVDGFGFGIRGAARLPVVIEAAGSLGAAAWEAVGTKVLSEAGLGVFREANAAGWPSRFYRFRFP